MRFVATVVGAGLDYPVAIGELDRLEGPRLVGAP
jgi:hypothetical protein